MYDILKEITDPPKNRDRHDTKNPVLIIRDPNTEERLVHLEKRAAVAEQLLFMLAGDYGVKPTTGFIIEAYRRTLEKTNNVADESTAG